MIKGIFIYSILLGVTILLALFLSPSKQAFKSDFLSKADSEVIVSNKEASKESMLFVLDSASELNANLEVVSDEQFEANLPQFRNSESAQQPDNVEAVDEDPEVVSEELRAQEVAYIPQTIPSIQLIDFDVTPNEMLEAERAYSEVGELRKNVYGLEDELVLAQDASDKIPFDPATSTGVVNYEHIESERLYQQLVEAGQILTQFEDPE